MFEKVFIKVAVFIAFYIYTIGWFVSLYGLSLVISKLLEIALIGGILFIALFCVSYINKNDLKIVNLLVYVVIPTFLFLSSLVFSLRDLKNFLSIKEGSTDLTRKVWHIASDIKPHSDRTRYLACTLSGTKMCFSFNALNLLIYRPYQICNIDGKLFYKELSMIRTYDILKSTYLIGNNVVMICEDTLLTKLFEFRERVANRIDNLIPKPQSSLLNGIVFGMDLSFTEEFERGVQASGINHIVAASGYNVSILVVALDKVIGWLPNRVGLVVKIVFIWIYALLTGFSSSMVRASAMTSISFIFQLFNNNIDVKRVFWVTFSVLIALNPFIVFDLGFLLSATATFGLMYISPVLERGIKVPWFPHTTLACTLATLPITMLHFQTLSPYSVIANMIILPVIEVVMLLGLVGLLIKPLIYLAWGCLKFVEIVSSAFANLPFSIVELSQVSSLIIAIILCLIMFFMIKQNNENKSNLYSS